MLNLPISDATRGVMVKLGIPLEESLMWWGALPSLQRADDQYSIFAPDRRAQLDALSRRVCENPSDITKRERGFYVGLLAETCAVIEAEAGPQ